MTAKRNPKEDSLTPMQRIVVDEVKAGRSWTAAARVAGYSDPSGAVDKLKGNPVIIDAILPTLQKKAASWSKLLEDARRSLERNMQMTHDDWCRSLEDPDPEHGYADCNCWFSKLRASDAGTAAKTVVAAVGRTDPEALEMKAKREDKALNDEEAARLFLDDLDTGGETVN